MGFFFFFFFFFFQFYKNFRYSSLSQLAFKYALFNDEGTQNFKEVRLNFFKKVAGLRFFFKKKKISKILTFFKDFKYSPEKTQFIVINLILNFFENNAFFSFLNLIFLKKLKKSYLLLVILQLFSVLEASEARAPVFFVNFEKFSDFFFFRKLALSSVNSLQRVLPSFLALRFRNVAAVSASPLSASKVKKFNFVVAAEPTQLIKQAQGEPAYLFLVNGLFSKEKSFFFLRNNVLYNKSRYSRNRQTYRTGVF